MIDDSAGVGRLSDRSDAASPAAAMRRLRVDLNASLPIACTGQQPSLRECFLLGPYSRTGPRALWWSEEGCYPRRPQPIVCTGHPPDYWLAHHPAAAERRRNNSAIFKSSAGAMRRLRVDLNASLPIACTGHPTPPPTRPLRFGQPGRSEAMGTIVWSGCRTTTSQKCEAVPKRARIEGS